MFETMAFIASISAEVERAQVREGTLMPEEALEGEQVRVREGRQDKLLTSQLRGGDPTFSYRLLLRYTHLLVYACRCLIFLLRLSPPRQWQFLDVFCYSLSQPFLGWQFCCVHIMTVYICWLM